MSNVVKCDRCGGIVSKSTSQIKRTVMLDAIANPIKQVSDLCRDCDDSFTSWFRTINKQERPA